MKTQNGFTLIELLLYISIVAVILLTVSGLLYTILQARVKNQTIAEVEQQGLQVMQIITQTIRNADNINSPTQGTTSTAVSLEVADAALNPTIFDLSNGVVRITEGIAQAVSLTSSKVTASSLSFLNLSQKSIKIQFTLTHINPGSKNEYDYSKVFYGTANVRRQN